MNTQIEKIFTYHPPKEGQLERYETIRDEAKQFAIMLEELVPKSREKDIALSRLEEVVMWANAGIARNE